MLSKVIFYSLNKSPFRLHHKTIITELFSQAFSAFYLCIASGKRQEGQEGARIAGIRTQP